MRFVVLATLFAAAMAIPTGNTGGGGGDGGDGGHDGGDDGGDGGDDGGSGGGSYSPCPAGLYSVPQCCATDALGIIILNCQTPKEQPKDAKHFQATCAKDGQQDKCCVLPVLGQALLCTDPIA